MAEHTTAGKAFVARIVHQLVPTIEHDFWRDDPNKGDVIQHLCFSDSTGFSGKSLTN